MKMERMCGTILEVNHDSLLIRDSRTDQEVLVRTNCTCGFQRGDRVNVLFNGAMTMSIPPQINAIRVSRARFNRCPR